MNALMLKQGMILNGTRTSAGTIVTIPANSMFNGQAVISASITLAATGLPRVVVTGASSEPANGAILHQLSITGLALTAITGSGTVDILVRTGAEPVNLDLVMGGASSATATINGFLV